MNYRLRPRAERDLEDIWVYSKNNWSVDQADRYHNQIVQVLKRIAADDSRDKPSPVGRDVFRASAGSHIVFFKRIGATVDVIRILHNRMDPERHLE